MSTIMTPLRAAVGNYVGSGINHDGDPFRGHMAIALLPADKGVELHFVATSMHGDLLHEERTWIVPDFSGNPVLVTVSSNVLGVLSHPLVEEKASGEGRVLIFRHGDPSDQKAFREEIRLTLGETGEIGYNFAWGLPGGEFAERSGLTLTPIERTERPDFIKHYRQIQEPAGSYPGSSELLSIGSRLARQTGLAAVGVHYEILPPGRRTSWPHAESCEEEFVFVVRGFPQAWINGRLYDLGPGDFVGFPAGTGILHTFLNNTGSEVHLIVGGEGNKPENKCVYALPFHAKRNEEIGEYLWKDAPPQDMGPHDGVPEKQRLHP